MSETNPAEEHQEAHSGPIKNPKQLLIAVLFSFVVPIFVIIGLVLFVTSANKPAPGVSGPDAQKALQARIQRIGTVEIRDANRPLKSGEDVFKAQCITCHGTGMMGAPKFQDSADWAPRIAKGYETLLHSALAGKDAMPPQGGGDFEDVEIGRAVVYMANAGGAKFPVPDRPAAAPTANAGAAATPAPAATAAAAAPSPAAVTGAAPVVAAATATAAPTTAAGGGAGEALYKQTCQMCHAAGVANAPKFGDKAAWAPRIATGMDTLVNAALHGMGAMPPKGGSTAPDADVRAAVQYMVDAAK
ncbi:cytochrome c5 family protein [Xylophilus rhododendri]|uniref:Cytochrome c5 family protein n=1 Tax=Xylophilus rhododendri TaxID=2697032 RepID=A0A857J7R7_9BURK|nr:c-type cytochrome [Xylophilus rhododendri]QHI99119.1 cytochrome c5 family protein [Xylophilus rhododendri]